MAAPHRNRPQIVLLIGIEGSGKSTLAPLVRDVLRGEVLFCTNSLPASHRDEHGTRDEPVHERKTVVASCIATIAQWAAADVDHIVVDGWYESLAVDGRLGTTDVATIEDEIESAGLDMIIANLVVDDSVTAISDRLAATYTRRGVSTSNAGPGNFVERAVLALERQRENRRFCLSSRFPALDVNTTRFAAEWHMDFATTIAAAVYKHNIFPRINARYA